MSANRKLHYTINKDGHGCIPMHFFEDEGIHIRTLEELKAYLPDRVKSVWLSDASDHIMFDFHPLEELPECES